MTTTTALAAILTASTPIQPPPSAGPFPGTLSISAQDMASRHLGTKDLNLAVYQIVRAIPPRKVITCEHIAQLVGFPSQGRRVREAVNFISHTSPPVAWYRVIPTSGVISIHGLNEQQRLLEAEGIEVNVGMVGESRVSVEKWGWFPETGDVRFDADTASEDHQEWGA